MVRIDGQIQKNIADTISLIAGQKLGRQVKGAEINEQTYNIAKAKL